MECKIRTKTIDMKEDIRNLGWDAHLLHRQHNQKDITESFFRQGIRKLAEQYANQRVIEELELIVKEINSFTATNRIEKRLLKTIKELKQ
jgi:hypothetical protein|tara:strand:+ start:217 stop:486 length:270 start_codon:yes stop_codon:yes gene_type:complete